MKDIDFDKIIERFQALNTLGQYRQAIHEYLIRDKRIDNDENVGNPNRLILQLHYAQALQHAGLFLNAQEFFKYTAGQAVEHLPENSEQRIQIVNTAKLHEGVLLERLNQPQEAIKAVAELDFQSDSQGVHMSWASPASFKDITLMKSYMTLKEFQKVKKIAAQCLNGDENQWLWGRLFISTINIIEQKDIGNSKSEVNDILSSIEEKDPHGAPWFGLTLGQHISTVDQKFAIEVLEKVEKIAVQEGKIFVIAAISHELCEIYKVGNEDQKVKAQYYLRRAIGGFQRCGVLLRPPVQEKIYNTALELLGLKDGHFLFRMTSGLVQREELQIGRMCKAVAKKRNLKLNKDQRKYEDFEIFEEFVTDWARYKYSHLITKENHNALEIIRLNENEVSVDVIVRYGKSYKQGQHEGRDAILIQAKLYTNPRVVKPNFSLTQIQNNYACHIREYVLVIARRGEEPWEEGLWNANKDQKKVRDRIPADFGNIYSGAILEPELQTEVLLNTNLFDEYFRYIYE